MTDSHHRGEFRRSRRARRRSATNHHRRAAGSAKLAGGHAARARRRRQPPAHAARAEAAVHRRRSGLCSRDDRANAGRRRDHEDARTPTSRIDPSPALPRDSAILMLQSFDYGAVNRIAREPPAAKTVPKNEVLYNLDQALLSTVTYLDEMIRAPRRPTAALTGALANTEDRQHAAAAAVVRDVDQRRSARRAARGRS